MGDSFKHNPYQLLQVAHNSSQYEIDAAYRRLAKLYHPDSLSGLASTRRMQELNWAYEILRDPSKRAHYDRWSGLQDTWSISSASSARAYSQSDDFTADSTWSYRPSSGAGRQGNYDAYSGNPDSQNGATSWSPPPRSIPVHDRDQRSIWKFLNVFLLMILVINVLVNMFSPGNRSTYPPIYPAGIELVPTAELLVSLPNQINEAEPFDTVPFLWDLVAPLGENRVRIYEIGALAVSEAYWGWEWCARSEDLLRENWSNQAQIFTINGEEMLPGRFEQILKTRTRVFVEEGISQQRFCQAFVIPVSQLLAGKYELITRAVFIENITDGWGYFSKGSSQERIYRLEILPRISEPTLP